LWIHGSKQHSSGLGAEMIQDTIPSDVITLQLDRYTFLVHAQDTVTVDRAKVQLSVPFACSIFTPVFDDEVIVSKFRKPSPFD
jgi:hypothetical protein